MANRSTDEMNTELIRADDLEKVLEENKDSFAPDGFPKLLKTYIRDKKINKASLAKDSGMSSVYLHQILSGRRTPSRNRLLCICIGLKLSLEETQEFLYHAGMGPLYSRNRWDAVIIFGISHGMDLFTINDLLFDANEKTLI